MRKIKVVFAQIFLVVLVLGTGYFEVSPVFAQDPTTWQDSATGLSVAQTGKTAGLGFVVQAKDWPLLSLSSIPLGQIKIPGSSASFNSETVDWAHNEMTFTYDGSSELKLWVSRLSPAIVAHSLSNTLRLFAGSGSTNLKYVAYSDGGNTKVEILSTSGTLLSALDQNWILVWYGSNSNFQDSKYPEGYYLQPSGAYQADTPILFVFETQPSFVKQSSEGGVDVSFSGPAGYVTLLPLFGRDRLRASETEGWSIGLPNNVAQKAQWWADHLCAYPVSVTEAYGYNQRTDTATITETINFLNVCTGNTTFAPIPPMLAIAKDALGVTFSGSVVDGNLPTEFGPSLGIENTQEYSWSVSGLRKYADSRRIITDTGQAPAGLEQELESEVQKIIDAGHFAPWIFLDYLIWPHRGDLYWANPADIIYHLTDVAEALPDGNLRNDLVNYIESERSNYPPEDVYNLDIFSGPYSKPVLNGATREDFSYYEGSVEWYWDRGIQPGSGCRDCRTDVVLKRVPLYNFYSLSRHYDLTGEALAANLLQKASDALDKDMREQDWATFYWFAGFEDFYAHSQAVANANRHFAGLVGYVKLAKKAGDTQAEYLGRALLAKAAVLRVGLAKYPRYLYAAGLIELPPEPDWQPNSIRSDTYGYLYNFHWTGPYDDVRQVGVMNQFQVYLQDHSGSDPLGFYAMVSPYLFTFRDMVPELGRLLGDYAKDDVQVQIDKVEAFYPHWYAAFGEGVFGAEHNLWHPINGFQTFMAKAWIQEESPEKLARYADISWLSQGGDLFYVHKLAEAIKAYRGVTWDDSPIPPTPTPSPPPAHCQPLGDIDCSGKVNALDLSVLLSVFGTNDPKADLDDSGKVNALDLSILLSNFGKTK